jgi:hypothetical protein
MNYYFMNSTDDGICSICKKHPITDGKCSGCLQLRPLCTCYKGEELEEIEEREVKNP